jgi:hypothetical protein
VDQGLQNIADTLSRFCTDAKRLGCFDANYVLNFLLDPLRFRRRQIDLVQDGDDFQPQFNRRSAEQVARAIGGRVEAIDPLAADYEENLRRVANSIAEAVRP